MSDFVNRALVSSAEDTLGHGLAGAIQTAIDRTDLNNMMGAANDATSWIDPVTQMDGDIIGANDDNFGDVFQGLDKSNLSSWIANEGSTAIQNGVRRNAGAPGELTQADILARIGAVLRPRSDTFTIRAKGQTGDSDEPDALAWCELTIQRSPEFVDVANAAEDSMSDLNSINQTFGRRFKIVSFRWLSEEEI